MIFFISATGTDIGKTFMVEKICQQLLQEKKQVKVIKPVISGFTPQDQNSDLHKILNALNLPANDENFKKISLYRLKEPLSPNIAAKKAGEEICFEKIVEFCKSAISAAKNNNEYLLIEGAGGVMTPISDDKLFIDLMAILKIPVILVIGDYLGTISHSLTAIAALKSYNIEIAKIIFNHRGAGLDDDVIDVIKSFGGVEISSKV